MFNLNQIFMESFQIIRNINENVSFYVVSLAYSHFHLVYFSY